MRFLQISLLVLLLTACTGTKTAGTATSAAGKVIRNNYFSDTKTDYVYKAKIRMGKKHFGGILILKKQTGDVYRVVFTTEFGNKLLDFKLKDGQMEVVSVMDELNRKPVLNTFRDDFYVLMKENIPLEEKCDTSNPEGCTGKIAGKKYRYIFDESGEKLLSIQGKGIGKRKLTIAFKEVKGHLAKEVSIYHPHINLYINLKYIGE